MARGVSVDSGDVDNEAGHSPSALLALLVTSLRGSDCLLDAGSNLVCGEGISG